MKKSFLRKGMIVCFQEVLPEQRNESDFLLTEFVLILEDGKEIESVNCKCGNNCKISRSRWFDLETSIASETTSYWHECGIWRLG